MQLGKLIGTILVAVFLAGCTAGTVRLAGTWQNSSIVGTTTLDLKADGTGSLANPLSTFSFKYEVLNDSQLRYATINSDGSTSAWHNVDYQLVNNDTLTIKNTDSVFAPNMTFTRKT